MINTLTLKKTSHYLGICKLIKGVYIFYFSVKLFNGRNGQICLLLFIIESDFIGRKI